MTGPDDLDVKISLLEFRPDDGRQHVVIHDQTLCGGCREKNCIIICPSGVFRHRHGQNPPVEVLYRQCIECGACRLVCPAENIGFDYPSGGFGVIFLEG